MTHCINCGRTLKNATETGMGRVCARRAKAVPVPEHDRDLFGYDIQKAAAAAEYRIGVHIAVLAEAAIAFIQCAMECQP